MPARLLTVPCAYFSAPDCCQPNRVHYLVKSHATCSGVVVALHEACARGDATAVEVLVSSRVDVNQRNRRVFEVFFVVCDGI